MDAQTTRSATNTPPSFALMRLFDLQHKFNRLQGLQIDTLKIMGMDELLNEFASVCFALESLYKLNSDMGVVDSAMQMLLQLLHAAEEEPLSPQGLHALMAPLQARHAANWETLSNLF